MDHLDYWTMYLTNETFRAYVDKYSRTHRMPPENAVKCLIVREYADYIRGERHV